MQASVLQLTSGCMALNTGKSITVIWLWKQCHTATIKDILQPHCR